MDADHDPSQATRVDYLPQSLIEKVCAADPDSLQRRSFESEIERVVFRHIDESDRVGSTNLAQLLHNVGAPQRQSLADARRTIREACQALTELESRMLELQAMGLAARRADLEGRARAIEEQLEAVAATITSTGTTEQQAAAEAHSQAVRERDQLIVSRADVDARIAAINDDLDAAAAAERQVAGAINTLDLTASDLAQRVGAQLRDILVWTYDSTPVETWRATQSTELASLVESTDSAGGLAEQQRVLDRRVLERTQTLEASGQEMQRLLRQQSDLRAQLESLRGDTANPESLAGVEALIEELELIPSQQAEHREELIDGFGTAHGALREIKRLQERAYGPVVRFVDSDTLAAAAALEFGVEFRARGFFDSWIAMVNRQKLGDFIDFERTDRDQQFFSSVNLDDPDSLLAGLDAVITRLRTERGAVAGRSRSLASIMRTAYAPASLMEAIYSIEWLQSQYVIRSEGRELSELSPGQRGLVLLLFYLLVDRSERPLVLDQPEENLDNETVRNVLVPALRDALRRRQVIAVTHNPNLAVVGDADQIIVAHHTDRFGYESGSLAAFDIGEPTIDILEGTRAAFTNREVKYNDVVGSAP
jgi:hypothetical protein